MKLSTSPYSIDLVRLAASAHIAIREADYRSRPRTPAMRFSQVTRRAFRPAGGRSFWRKSIPGCVPWSREFCAIRLRTGQNSTPCAPGGDEFPRAPGAGSNGYCPNRACQYRIAHRIAGLGSLGRERYVAIADYRGARIAREAKALAPSAFVWASQGKRSDRIRYQEILDRSVRAIDPFVRLKGRWIVRRLAPDCSRVELAHMPKERDESKLLRAMGFETANVHLGTPRAAGTILQDLGKRPRHWLHDASIEMVKATTDDFRDWRALRAKPKR